MKICPTCGYLNETDHDFCVRDGTTLGAPQDETVTQWAFRPPGAAPAAPAAAGVRPGFVYALVGALAAAVIILGAYIVLVPKEGGATPNANVATPLPGSNILSQGTAATNSTRAAQNVSNAAETVATPVANAAMVPSNKPRPTRPDREDRFNRTYEGSVGDGGVTMSLQRNGSRLTGRVFPYGRSAEIYLEGYIGDDGTFSMSEKSDIGVVTGEYNGSLNADGTMTGTWSKPGGDKPRWIYLTRR